MSTNDSSTQARGVEQIRASLERITRAFDNMIGRMRMDNATIRMLSDRLPPIANRGQSKPASAAIPAGWQSFIESQAKQKAAGKELVTAASAFCEELIRWAREIVKRESKVSREGPALVWSGPIPNPPQVEQPSAGEPKTEIPPAEGEEVIGPVIDAETLMSVGITGLLTAAGTVVAYGAYKARVEPAQKDEKFLEQAMEGQMAREAYQADHDPDYPSTLEDHWQDDVTNAGKGGILKEGEYWDKKGNIRLSNGEIAVRADGTSVLSNEEREAIAADYAIAVKGGVNPFLSGKAPDAGTRKTGSDRAKILEVQLVKMTGTGTLDWTPSEIAFFQQTGKLPPGIVGHHINNVAIFPDWAGDARNIQLVRGQDENLDRHGRNFQNPSFGPLIDRAAMIVIRKATGEKQ